MLVEEKGEEMSAGGVLRRCPRDLLFAGTPDCLTGKSLNHLSSPLRKNIPVHF
jgi:hypothetical protein